MVLVTGLFHYVINMTFTWLFCLLRDAKAMIVLFKVRPVLSTPEQNKMSYAHCVQYEVSIFYKQKQLSTIAVHSKQMSYL